MRIFALLFLAVTFSYSSSAQEIKGQWNGILKVPGGQLTLVFHIDQNGNAYSATMDSPDQGAKGIPVTSVTLKDSVLVMEVSNLKIKYTGKWKGQIIEGSFVQNGQPYPLNLGRDAIVKEKALRPQEPQKPYPYYSEDVQFVNKKAGFSLAGTLTLPSKTGKYPAAILISGSGPQNRDEELAGHKPFLVLSDYLTKNGLAVLRCDDRGTGESKGNFSNATTPDFASDVMAAIEFLKNRPEIDGKKIGLIGHSEGGLIAPMVAAESGDVSFIVLLAGPGLPGDQILEMQARLIGKANGLSDEILDRGDVTNRKLYNVIKEQSDTTKIKSELTSIMEDALKTLPVAQQPPADQKDAFVASKVNPISTPWFRFFIKYDPRINLEKVKCPVLALNGENDLQVPPKENMAAIKQALEKAGNKNFTLKELPKLNHLFQESATGSPSEYASIEQTFSPLALKEISEWISSQVKK